MKSIFAGNNPRLLAEQAEERIKSLTQAMGLLEYLIEVNELRAEWQAKEQLEELIELCSQLNRHLASLTRQYLPALEESPRHRMVEMLDYLVEQIRPLHNLLSPLLQHDPVAQSQMYRFVGWLLEQTGETTAAARALDLLEDQDFEHLPLDLFIAYSPLFPRNEKRKALRRLARNPLFARPIARERWDILESSFLAAIRDRAGQEAKLCEVSEKTGEKIVVQNCVKSGLVLTIPELGPYKWPEAVKVLHSRLNEYVTQDLLAPGWRNEGRHISEAELEAGLEAELIQPLGGEQEARLSLRSLINRAKLTLLEIEALTLRGEDKKYEEIAHRLGITPVNARVIHFRAKEKLRRVA